MNRHVWTVTIVETWYLHDISAFIWIRKYRWLIAISSYAHMINKISIAELLANFNSFLFIFTKILLIYNNSALQICLAAPIRRNPTRKKIKRNRCFHSQYLSENESPVSYYQKYVENKNRAHADSVANKTCPRAFTVQLEKNRILSYFFSSFGTECERNHRHPCITKKIPVWPLWHDCTTDLCTDSLSLLKI